VDGRFLKSAGELFASDLPFYAVRGNHDIRGEFSYNYFDYFPNCNNNPWYSFRSGPAYFIFLDSGEDKPESDIRYFGLSVTDQMRKEEAEWLRSVVEMKEFKEAPVKIVIMHMPPMQNGWYGTREVNRLFMPVLNQAGIDLMLCGHTHRLSYSEKGTENSFPLLINSNTSRVDLHVTGTAIEARVVDGSGNVVKSYNIQK